MADNQNTTTTSTSHQNSSSTTNHLGTDIPSGNIDNDNNARTEKHEYSEKSDTKHAAADDDDEEEEDMDALIDELESQDGGVGEEEEEEGETGEAPPVPEELLQTDTRMGLTEHEVSTRRKKYGLNQMKEDKENLVLKFLGYFVGPIQFVMEVSVPILSFLQVVQASLPYRRCATPPFPSSRQNAKRKAKHADQEEELELKHFFHRLLPSLPPVYKIGSISVSFVLCYFSTPPSVSSKSSKLVQLSTS